MNKPQKISQNFYFATSFFFVFLMFSCFTDLLYPDTATVASFPFSDGFESGSLGSYWTTSSTNNGQIQVTGTGTPYAGSYHVLMDCSTSGTFSLNELVLHIDLSGQSNVELAFRQREYSDEDHTSDAVAISEDGITWHKILDLTGTNSTSTYQEHVVDLDAAVAMAGISYDSHFYIKFMQYDDDPYSSDGFAFDNIEVRQNGLITVASFPFSDDFEWGSLRSYWTTSSTNNGQIQVTGTGTPYAGSYHVLMDCSTSGTYSLNELVLHIDLSGQSNVELAFRQREYSDEDHTSDAVAISEDGISWHKILDLTGTNSTSSYQEHVVDLDAAVAAAGISYDSHFYIKFLQYDDDPHSSDGFAFDNIEVRQLTTPITTCFKHYGGVNDDYAYSIQHTSDGGYIVAGYSYSYTHGMTDFAIYRLNSIGNKVWFKHYGGTNYDWCYSIQQTSDGGYVAAGETLSYTHGGYDFAIYKLDSNGNKQWFKHYGGTGSDVAKSIQQTSDGGYIVAGTTNSFTHGDNDFAIYKLDSNGIKQWFKHYGGANQDYAYSIQQTSDGGYIVAGETNSYTHGNYDFAIYKLNSSGNKVWFRHYGGINSDGGWTSVQQTTDGGYILSGETYSYTYGNADFAIYKLNSIGNKIWFKHYGGTNYDRAKFIQQTTDGGYIIAGYTTSYTYGSYDFAIYRLNSSGNNLWFKHYGGINNDSGESIKQTSDGGYVVAGYTESYTYGAEDFAIYKLDQNGNK